jgi:hypothetical protein
MIRRDIPAVKRLSLILAALAGSAWLLAATPAQALTASDQKEVQSFKLSDDFLDRYEAVTEELQSLDDEVEDDEALDSETATLDQLTGNIAASPDKSAILKRHGLSARQLVVGSLVLARAQMTDIMQADPSQAQYVDKAKTPSDANMAFYRAHKAEIDKVLGYSGDMD